ncbi:uncharacterized protein DEA37_0000548 [Paragonimus westermani]|uniref:Reverse transcriptase RNase H-like domain-containing protein n=1 Tax=Paragonimus westermani TaxID=34504 RepID=A0A5J4N3J5_9TREM|nr:uncharacterized protein DEA37_0000548 [Paragonimus westermani]
MSIKDDLSPSHLKSICAQPTVMHDRGEFRSSLRQSHVSHPNNDLKSWGFFVTIYLAGVPEKSMGSYISSFLNEEAAKMFRTTGVHPKAPVPVIWETPHHLFEKLEPPASHRENSSRRQRPEESVDSFLRSSGTGFSGIQTLDASRLRTVLEKCERNCCTTRRELLALLKFLRHFRPYMLSKPFKVRTNHQSLQWLRNFSDPESQVARWQKILHGPHFFLNTDVCHNMEMPLFHRTSLFSMK